MDKWRNLLEDNNDDSVDKAIKKGLKTMFDQDLRKEFQQELAKQALVKQVNIDKSNVFSMRWTLAIAASLAILVACLFVLLPTRSATDLAQSFVSNSTVIHPGQTKGNNQDADVFRQQAIQSFQSEQYEQSAEYFAMIEEPTEQDLYYQALSLLKNEDYAASVVMLNRLKDSPTYAEEVKWFLALGQLLNNNLDNAKTILENFRTSDWKYDEAQKLLKKL